MGFIEAVAVKFARPCVGPWLAVMLFSAIAFPVPSALAQEVQADEISTREVQPSYKFQVERNLVVVRAIVRDSKGKPVTNLRKEDFQILDRGKPQTISQFSVEVPEAKQTASPERKAAPAERKGEEVSEPVPVAPLRYVALYFDDVHCPFEDLVRTRDAATQYVATALQARDRIGIFTTSGQNQLDFTDDADRLREALSKLQPRPITPRNVDPCVYMPDYEAYKISMQHDPVALQVATEEVLQCRYNGDRRMLQVAQRDSEAMASQVWSMSEAESLAVLRGLMQLTGRMALLPGQRTLALVSSGFLTETLRFEISEAVDRALRDNITISALDARGLYTPPAVRDMKLQPVNSPLGGLVFGEKQEMISEEASLGADGMSVLSSETGGTFFQNNNDYNQGFRVVGALPEVYYVLAFSPQNVKYDGSYHSLKVRLVSGRGLTVQARKGYYAPKKPLDPSVLAKEEIEQVLYSQDELHELPVEVHTQFFKMDDDDARVAVVTRVSLAELQLRKEAERNVDNITFVTAVFDRDGKLVTGVQKVLHLRLRDSSLAILAKSGLTVKAHFDLKPGTYTLRAVVRDSEGGRICGLNRTVEIPY
jgi:VWFA-related protein